MSFYDMCINKYRDYMELANVTNDAHDRLWFLQRALFWRRKALAASRV